jgi:hypothetical protein
MRTNRTRNGVVFNLGEFALTASQAPQPMIFARRSLTIDDHHYCL